MTAPHEAFVAWSIAGSDSGGGAGLQADLRAFDSFPGVFGCTAVAAVTAQNSRAVERVEPLAADLLDAQLAALASDLPPRVIKTGMLGSVANVRCVANWVDRLRQRGPLALVVDPVWRASSGAELGSQELRQALLGELLPRASLITPNRAEAAWLLDLDAAAMASASEVERAALALRKLGCAGVAVTGGDAGSEFSSDYIDTPQAGGWLLLPRVATPHHHGSGCVFAASAAAAMALGFCAADAAVLAKMSTTRALRHAMAAGRGAGVVRPGRGFALLPDLLPRLQSSPTTTGVAAFPELRSSLGLYAVVDSADTIERVLAAGVRSVQLRIKQGSSEQLSSQIRRSVDLARRSEAQLFINDHWQLAIEHGAYGVHLGQEDLDGADLAALRAAGLRLGLSSHSHWEVCRALACQPSYIACGPIHATVTKDMPWIPQGPGNLAYWCRALQLPLVAIGGMDEARSREAARCGADGIAVLRGIAQAADLELHVRNLQQAISEGRRAQRIPAPELSRPSLAA